MHVANSPNPVPSSEELQAVHAALAASGGRLVSRCRGLDESGWHRSDGPGRWRVSDLVEHLVITESRAQGGLAKMVEEPAVEDWMQLLARKIDLAAVEMPTVKVEAPEPLRPSGTIALESLLPNFTRTRAATVAIAANAQPWKQWARNHPVVGRINGLEFLWLIHYHTLRHVGQIERCLA